MDKQVAFIGTGPISHFQIQALKAANISVGAIASMRRGSTRLGDVKQQHEIANAFEDWEEMLSPVHGWDGIVIATHVDGLGEAFQAASELDLPILVEKPVAWSADEIAKLSAFGSENVMVGYHRRFYKPVSAARQFIRNGDPVIATMVLPESPPTVKRFLRNSCHGMDMLGFLFQRPKLVHVRQLTSPGGQLAGFAAQLASDRGDIIQLLGNWGTPANIQLWLDRHDRRFELKPFERAFVYQGMTVLDPTPEIPIRRYEPTCVECIELDPWDADLKPGFLSQARAFRRLLDGKGRDDDAATLDDAHWAIRLAEELVAPHEMTD